MGSTRESRENSKTSEPFNRKTRCSRMKIKWDLCNLVLKRGEDEVFWERRRALETAIGHGEESAEDAGRWNHTARLHWLWSSGSKGKRPCSGTRKKSKRFKWHGQKIRRGLIGEQIPQRNGRSPLELRIEGSTTQIICRCWEQKGEWIQAALQILWERNWITLKRKSKPEGSVKTNGYFESGRYCARWICVPRAELGAESKGRWVRDKIENGRWCGAISQIWVWS